MTKRWLGPVVIVLLLVFTAVLYGSLPERVPTHWNVRGEVDGWSARWKAALIGPVATTLIRVLMPVLRRVDPRRRNYDRFDPTFWLVVNTLVLFMAGMHVVTLGAAAGWSVDIPRVTVVILGLLFAVLGNYMPRLRSNWWMGIRTPWTLENEVVWRATHRLAGWTFVIGGVLIMASALLPPMAGFVVAISSIAAGAFIPFIYSYVRYRQELGRSGDGA